MTTMTTFALRLPDSLMSTLRLGPRDVERELPLAAAIHWYQQGRLSMERAAEIAGLHRIDFLLELGRRKIDAFHVDLDELREEAARD